MQTIHQTVEVTFRYPVCFTRDLFRVDNPLLQQVVSAQTALLPARLLFVVDAGAAEHRPELLDAIAAYCAHRDVYLHLAGAPLLVPGGERAKQDPAVVERIHRAIHECGVDRHSYVVAVGGGAVIDAVGYAAATAHRGVRLIRVPTTVLSQNDSAVGVKNSVNLFGKKNFLGTFAPPTAVLNDSAFLRTLADRDWRGGVSEAIKVALLKDPAFFRYMEGYAGALKRREMEPMQHVIHRCAQLHLRHIASSGDPFELGSSRPLDFGHWAAHKLEALSGYELRHGEAVAIGLALDSTYSHLAGLLSEYDWKRILRLLTALGLPVYSPELGTDGASARPVLAGLDEFREHLGGELTVMLLRRIGEGQEVHELDEETIVRSIRMLGRHSARYEQGGRRWDTPTPALVR